MSGVRSKQVSQRKAQEPTEACPTSNMIGRELCRISSLYVVVSENVKASLTAACQCVL